MPVLTFHSFKGGSGKSTLANSFAYYCSSNLKKKTLLIDCDINAPNLHLFFSPAMKEGEFPWCFRVK